GGVRVTSPLRRNPHAQFRRSSSVAGFGSSARRSAMRSCRPRAWSMITSRLVSDTARSEEPGSGDGHSELVEPMIRAGGSMVDAGSAHPPIVDLDPNLLLGPALLLLGVIRVGLFVRLRERR